VENRTAARDRSRGRPGLHPRAGPRELGEGRRSRLRPV